MHLSSNAKVAVVTAGPFGMDVGTYPTKLDMVLALMNNGSIGGQHSHWGSDEHKAALAQIEKQLAAVRDGISKHEAQEAAGDPLIVDDHCPDCSEPEAECACGPITEDDIPY